MAKNSIKKFEVKQEIFDLIKKHYDLRMQIAEFLNEKEHNVKYWGYRKSHTIVGFPTVANIIKKFANLTDEDFYVHPLKK